MSISNYRCRIRADKLNSCTQQHKKSQQEIKCLPTIQPLDTPAKHIPYSIAVK